MKIAGLRSPGYRILLTLSLLVSLLTCLFGGEAVIAAEPEVVRSLPESINQGESFTVSVTFSAPADDFNAVGLSDSVPDGWTINMDSEESDPPLLDSYVDSSTVYFLWDGPYTVGTEFTAVYRVTVPADAEPGTYGFTGGQLEYYILSEKYTATVTGLNSIEVSTSEVVSVRVDVPAFAPADSDFTASILIDQVENLNAADYIVSFDPAVLRLDQVENGLIGTTAVPAEPGVIDEGVVKIVNNLNQPAAGISGSGSLAVLHFHVIGASGQTSLIGLSSGTLSDDGSGGSAKPIPASWTGGTVTVKIPVTITLSNRNHVYDGTAKYAAVTTNPVDVEIKVTYSREGTPVSHPVSAGTYDIFAEPVDPQYGGTTSGTLTIAKADQTIAFSAISDKGYASPDFAISASASSDLPVTFTAHGCCELNSGNIVHITGIGECSITASQSGNNNYNPAPDAVRSFHVLSVPGDINGDGDIDALDITKMVRIILELEEVTPTADVNSDGSLNSLDITDVELIILDLYQQNP